MCKCTRAKFLGMVLSVCSLVAHAQSSMLYNDPDADFKTAQELFQKKMYPLAYGIFQDLYKGGGKGSRFPVAGQQEHKLYYLICGLLVDDASVIPTAEEIAQGAPNSPAAAMLAPYLAEYFFRKGDFETAKNYYSKSTADKKENNETNVSDAMFHLGYVQFAEQQFDSAKTTFDAIRKDLKNKNYYDVNYYYGFICFYKKEYAEALQCFQLVAQYDKYQYVVPFYIAEIYYYQSLNTQALVCAEKYIQQGGQYYDLRLKQLAGYILFEQKEYKKSLLYFKQFSDGNDSIGRLDLYEIACCYYKLDSLAKAIDGFKLLGGSQDSIAQNSMYLLADAYLRIGQKTNARNAFLFCATNDSSLSEKESSLFLYAKLSYELGYTDIALKALQHFIATYPQSKNITEAKEILLASLASTSNYKDAVHLFKEIPNQSVAIKKIYPQILYGRATELVNDNQLAEADTLLNLLLNAPYNSSQLAFAYFWKAEIAYRQGNFDAGIDFFYKYFATEKMNGEVTVANANYGMGYCFFRKANYDEASNYFAKVATTLTTQSSTTQEDAFLRIADCDFMLKNYSQALQKYEQTIQLHLKQFDYAIFQKAIILGALGKQDEKISMLKYFLQQYPESNYNVEAQWQIVQTYFALQQYTNALTYLQNILHESKAQFSWVQAELQTGIAQFNLDNSDDALQTFKHLVTTYPQAPESDLAIEYIRNIFIHKQMLPEYVAFMKETGKNITESEADSLAFSSAMLSYNDDKLIEAAHNFVNYIKAFPNGKDFLRANYYLAEINRNNNQMAAALPYYEIIANQAPNKFAIQSALQVAKIYYDKVDYENACRYFEQTKFLATQPDIKLEAMRGLLHCEYRLNKFDSAATNAQELLQESKLSQDDEIMCNMVLAKQAQATGQLTEATIRYKNVIAIGKSEMSAEARYHLATLLFLQNDTKRAEQTAFDVIKKYGSYEYWVTKSYLLLAAIYLKEGDTFNAKATLKSVADNATTEELKREAISKLAELEIAEETNKK